VSLENLVEMLNKDFWNGKRVYITGNTGFKGSWLSLWLHSMGTKIQGYSLKPNESDNLFEIAQIDKLVKTDFNDIRDFNDLSESLNNFSPEIVFHMAAQPLVRYSYVEPLETYQVNAIGTANLLEASKKCKSVKAVINITTDKCYENKEMDYAYEESDPMGGYDPYSSSKGCAELITSAYRRSFYNNLKVGLASVRAGNVIGGGDWSQDRLIPDILKSYNNNETIVIRNPDAVRPWQHVLEPLYGYLLLAQNLYMNPKQYSSGWNFGPYKEDIQTVESIVKEMSSLLPSLSWKIDDKKTLHEAKLLMLAINKAIDDLEWKPIWNLSIALKKILEFNECWINKKDVQSFCFSEIKEYEKDRGL
jgi:CDP-glucose 4,6-dehydratase